MAYSHLTADERCHIYELHVQGLAVTQIGEAIRRSKGTVSRELRRNRGQRGYRPLQAQTMYAERREGNSNARKLDVTTYESAEEMLRQGYSPEQTSGRMRRLQLASVSHESLYQHIYRDKQQGGDLHIHLRCQKKRRKRYGSGRSKRGQIPNRVGIEKRSARVEDRAIVAHWEGDTVIGKNHKGAIVTLVERKSRFTLIHPVRDKNAQGVADAIVKQMTPYQSLARTLTLDNGLEFAAHEQVTAALGTKVYFAAPYHSWQRGLNEYTNGLIRQYLPKKTCFSKLTMQDTQTIADQLNNRPRKCLDYQTPLEVFSRALKTRSVALGI